MVDRSGLVTGVQHKTRGKFMDTCASVMSTQLAV